MPIPGELYKIIGKQISITENIGTLRDKVSFISLIVDVTGDIIPQNYRRVERQGNVIYKPLPVTKGKETALGAYFYTEEDIIVPKLSAKANLCVGWTAEDMECVYIPAQNYFVLTYLECLALFIHPEYCGMLRYRATDKYAELTLRWSTVRAGTTLLPTPYFRVEGVNLFEKKQILCTKINGAVDYNNAYGLAYQLREKFPIRLEKPTEKANKTQEKTCLDAVQERLKGPFPHSAINTDSINKGIRNTLMLDKLLKEESNYGK